MATILEFRASSQKPARPVRRRIRRSAEIVIFPGIRYERWNEPQAQPGNTQAPAALDKRQAGE